MWITALDAAHGAIDGNAATRDAELAERESVIAVRETQWAEQIDAAASHTATLEASLSLAREQLAAANQRAEGLEGLLQTREGDIERLRKRGDSLEAQALEFRGKLDKLTERMNAMLPMKRAGSSKSIAVDRAAKDAAKDHERQIKGERAQVTQAQSQRDELKHELVETRADLRVVVSKRAQAERRLAAVMLKAVKAARAAQSKVTGAARTQTRSRRR